MAWRRLSVQIRLGPLKQADRVRFPTDTQMSRDPAVTPVLARVR